MLTILGRTCLQAMAALAQLSPEAFFSSGRSSVQPTASSSKRKPTDPAPPGSGAPNPFITRDAVRGYEAALKQLFLQWAAGGSEAGAAAVEATLGAIRARSSQEPPEHLALLPGGLQVACSAPPALLCLSSTPPLLHCSSSQDATPPCGSASQDATPPCGCGSLQPVPAWQTRSLHQHELNQRQSTWSSAADPPRFLFF